MTALRVLPEAEEELAEAARWYETKRVGLGVELIATVDEALEKILDAPLLHPVWRPDRPYRRAILSRFPYVIFFHADAEVVQVVAIAHAKRRPGYWLERVT